MAQVDESADSGTAAAPAAPLDGKSGGTSGPRRRSDATREAILAAARERFAADGYERATIRAIARDARIDPSMVMRYYGNKEGLFAAACAFDLRLPQVPTEAEKGVGRLLVRHFLEVWNKDEGFTALMRVGVTNPAAADRMQQVLREQLLPLAEQLSPDPAQAPLRATLSASQILGMALTRYVLRFPGAVAMDEEEVIDWLAPTIERYLTAEGP
ncbi:TetR/AcrR family transcriptional regulator [Streptomyces sp. NA04227]|uniref:TetR/AcrR family transcriptional regulator n=1 Tax=Streptomyces sp. NA04227 TaxID=2742136 RepID=UPI00159290FE|nr:TetR family transcriptional regulator [Streptomyces sp. NA04227]QKW06490.1 TetR/AcrR family transcriptional regulator [Streptomyces sp. NA04227]